MSADEVEDLGKSPAILRAYRERSGPSGQKKAENWAAITAALGTVTSGTPPAMPPESALAPTKPLAWGGLVGLASLGLALAIGGALWATRATEAPRAAPESTATESRELDRPEEPTAPSARTIEPPPVAVPATDPERAADPTPRRAAARATSEPEPTSSAPAASAPSTLGEELAILTEARASVARGDARAALDALDRHAERFSGGALATEREVTRISALCLAHRRADAERVAAALAPSPAIDRALARCGAP